MDDKDQNSEPAQDLMHDENSLESAKKLVELMERGDMANACDIIRDLSRVREDSLFYQIGHLTRELHESLKSFQDDSRINHLANDELPDARTRLTFVIEKTEEAANRTMDNIDNTLPISNNLSKQATHLKEEWTKFERRELTVEEFRTLFEEMMAFLDSTQEQADTIHKNLSDVVLAQDFQDLTGQVIRRVIKLVTDVEDSLVRLIKIAGETQAMTGKNQTAVSKPDISAEGPQVGNNKDNENVVSGQDEVDDLLSSLGF